MSASKTDEQALTVKGLTLNQINYSVSLNCFFADGSVPSNKQHHPSNFSRPFSTGKAFRRRDRFCWGDLISIDRMDRALVDHLVDQAVTGSFRW